MAIEFRCEKCGKSLRASSDSPARVQCPHCGRNIRVPAALAGLPTPQVPPQPPAEPPPNDAVDPSPAEPAAVVALASAMPWVISMFLHLGMFLVMVFIVMISATSPPPETGVAGILPPDPAVNEGPVRNPAKEREDDPEKSDNPRRVSPPPKAGPPIDSGKTDEKIEDLLGPSAEAGFDRGQLALDLADGGEGFYGDDTVGRPDGPGDGGGGGGVHNIIYVVDRSGSMAPMFDEVRVEMLRSIGRLSPAHSFHIVLFSDNEMIEGPAQRLAPATDEHKLAAVRFLQKQHASGRTTALVALKSAFAAFRYANGPGNLIYLLSDGDFAGVTGGSRYRAADGKEYKGNEAVLRWLAENNRNHTVQINTFLLHSRDRAAVNVLQTIAHEHDGRFKYISPDESPG